MGETPDNQEGKRPINHAGRKGLWDEGMIESAYLYCLEHHGTDQDLANHLGIGYRTLYDYMERYPQFSQAIKDGRKRWRQNGCGNAVRSVYRKLDMEVITLHKVKEKKVVKRGKLVLVERTEISEPHLFMPDQRAIEFVLTNQDPENWRRYPEISIVDNGPSPADLVRESIKEIKQLHQTRPSEE